MHLWGVVGRPVEFATQGPTGPSPASSVFYRPIRWYAEAAYLNHGYAFFAPNPGPSHLIRVEVPVEQGESVTYTYPDLRRQWPRLLYHRHFMLTEFLHNTFQPPTMPEEVAADPGLAVRWNNDRRRYEAVRGSMRRHLVGTFGSDDLTLRRVEHQLVGLPEFLYDRLRLDDPQLYLDLPEDPAEFRSGDFAPQGLPGFGSPDSGRPPRDERAPAAIPRFGAPNQPEPLPGRPGPPRGNLPGSGR